MLTRELLRELFYYEPSTGWLIRRVGVNPNAKRGQIAGTVDGKGYLHINIKQKLYRVHRLVWLYHCGSTPELNLDHINGVVTDNRIENLRLANQSQNNANRHKLTGTTSKYRGVSIAYGGRRGAKYQAQTKYKGKSIHLGVYDSEEEAYSVYREKMKSLHGDYFNG